MIRIRTKYFLLQVAVVIWVSVLSLQARTYLTSKQAEKVCFPLADKFEWKTHRYSMEEMKKIHESSRLKVIDPAIWFGVAYKNNTVIGVLAFDRCIGKHEYIDYVIALTPEGKVKQVEILSYRESWGYEVRREGWRKQFIGKNAAAKIDLNDGIHKISGATLSCRGITRGVKRVCHTWDVVLHPALVAGGALSKRTAKD